MTTYTYDESGLLKEKTFIKYMDANKTVGSPVNDSKITYYYENGRLSGEIHYYSDIDFSTGLPESYNKSNEIVYTYGHPGDVPSYAGGTGTSDSGSQQTGSASSSPQTCPACLGRGSSECTACDGSGKVISYHDAYADEFVYRTCTICNGTGAVSCKVCHGDGTIYD